MSWSRCRHSSLSKLCISASRRGWIFSDVNSMGLHFSSPPSLGSRCNGDFRLPTSVPQIPNFCLPPDLHTLATPVCTSVCPVSGTPSRSTAQRYLSRVPSAYWRVHRSICRFFVFLVLAWRRVLTFFKKNFCTSVCCGRDRLNDAKTATKR